MSKNNNKANISPIDFSNIKPTTFLSEILISRTPHIEIKKKYEDVSMTDIEESPVSSSFKRMIYSKSYLTLSSSSEDQ